MTYKSEIKFPVKVPGPGRGWKIWQKKPEHSAIYTFLATLLMLLDHVKLDNFVLFQIDNNPLIKDTSPGKRTAAEIKNLADQNKGSFMQAFRVKLMAVKSLTNLQYTTTFIIEPKGHNRDEIEVTVRLEGMVQMPSGVNHTTFVADSQEVLKSGYLTRCYEEFISFTAHILVTVPVLPKSLGTSDVSVQVIVPSPNGKCDPFYERNFRSEDVNLTWAPGAYRELDMIPPYFQNSLDPFEYLFWMMVLNYWRDNPIDIPKINFITPMGVEVSGEDAGATLVMFREYADDPITFMAERIEANEIAKRTVLEDTGVVGQAGERPEQVATVSQITRSADTEDNSDIVLPPEEPAKTGGLRVVR